MPEYPDWFRPADTRYWKQEKNGYIVSIGTGAGAIEITAEEYAEIKAVIDTKPMPPDGYDYRLSSELEWELHELPPAPDPETLPCDDPLEALELLIGGDVDE